MTPSSPKVETENRSQRPPGFFGTATLKEMFSIDLRALAILRIAVGLLILLDLYQRLPLFQFFYGESGFLDRATNQVFCPPSAGFWSVYWMIDQPWFAGLLMAISAVSAVGLIFGFRSREMTALSLILFWSLNVRNPLVTTAGHILLRMFLFWMLFLPVSAVWSLDARLRRRKESDQPAGHRHWSMASVGIMIQFVAMYLFSGIAKWNEIWFRGDAIQLAMQFHLYVKPFGNWLEQYPNLLATATIVTLAFELIAPLMLFMPWGNRFWRVFFALAMVGMHIGIWLTMSIGIFSWVAIAGWVLFLPAELWRRKKTSGEDITPAQNTSFALPIWTNVIAAGVLIFVLAMNTANVSPAKSNGWFPATARMIGNFTMLVQEFKMFARPSEEEFWFEVLQVPAEDPNDPVWISGVDRSQDSIWEPRPDSIYHSMKSNHHRRASHAIAVLKAETEADRLAIEQIRARLARSWAIHLAEQDPGSDPETTIELNCYRRQIDLDFPQPPMRETWYQGPLSDE